MQLYPLLFEPNLQTVVWGGNQLSPFKGLEPSDQPIGESLEVSAVPTNTSIVSNGVYAGKDLITVINEQPDAILGKKVNEKYNGQLPLLVKFIDAKRDLSIQVHPNDEMAMREHGKMGKSEFEISEDLTFFMPVANVTISAEFELIPTFAITIAEGIENGTVVADKQEAAEGDVITLTITPAEGFELDYITVTGVNTNVAVPVEDNKFTMPADAVNINAAFKATATGINAIAVDKLDNAVIYNLQGQRVEKSQAKGGVFIVNGKKVAIK